MAAAVELHPAIRRTFALAAEYDAAVAQRALACVDRLLESRMFAGSVLSMEGFPFEIAFSSADSALRYTVDPGRSTTDAVNALASPPDPFLLDRITQLQQRGALRFKAFIGGRHSASGDRFKIYCEVPEDAATDADALACELMGSESVLPHRRQRIEMFALDPYARRVEFYARIENMTAPEVVVLLGRAGLRARFDEVIGLLQKQYPFRIRRELPGTVFGYSYSLPLDGGPPAFTLYTYARTMFGWDGKIREKLLALAHDLSWDLSFYERLTRPLATRQEAVTSHTMFGVTVADNRPLAINFGVVPPDEP
jgi:hypothetical protein